MARRKDHPNNAFEKSTRYAMQQRAKQRRPAMLKARAKIPPIFGTGTYVFAVIAANGGVLRQTDISVSLGETAARASHVDARYAGMLRTFRLQTKQGRGQRAVAVMFDETFPLAKEVRALARKIGETHPFAIENNMPDEVPPPPSRGTHRIDLIAGSEVNTLVLATVRALRGKVSRVQLEAAVPHDSLTAVERAVARLREANILAGGKGRVYFADAPWRPQLEKLYDGYLRLRPEIREAIRARSKAKKQMRAGRYVQGLFGYAVTERALTAMAIHGAMPRTKLGAIAMLTHDETMFKPLIEAGLLATERRRGERTNVWIGLNAACPIYRELRATLLALAGEPNTRVTDISDPQPEYAVATLFNTAPLFWGLLFMNSVARKEIDVASLNRLRNTHANFTLHERMDWLLEQGVAKARREGLIVYYSLDPEHRAHKPLKRLLDKIAKTWPDLVDAAQWNDHIKPARRKTIDGNARRIGAKKAS